MTPMIDIVFLLLVFFVWTASFHIVEDSLPTSVTAELGEMESSEIPEDIEFDEVVVRVFWSSGPSWTLNDLPLENLGDLRVRLKAIAQIKNDTRVIIHPENNVPIGDIIDVFDTAQIVGFEKIQFATNSNPS